MNGLTKLNGLAVSVNLIPLLAMMNQLSKKPNKTREEEEVLVSFKKSMASAVFVTLLGIAIILHSFNRPSIKYAGRKSKVRYSSRRSKRKIC